MFSLSFILDMKGYLYCLSRRNEKMEVRDYGVMSLQALSVTVQSFTLHQQQRSCRTVTFS